MVTKINLNVINGKLFFESSGNNTLENCRMYVSWRYDGENEWVESYSNEINIEAADEDKIIVFTQIEHFNLHIIFKKTDNRTITAQGKIINKSGMAVEVARVHYLDGNILDPSTKLLSMAQYELPGRAFRFGEETLSPREYIEKAWSDMGVFWPRLSEPVHDCKNTAISRDIGMLAREWTKPGWFFGFYKPGLAEGEIGFRTKGEKPSFYCGALLDGILMDSDESRELENFIISYGELQDEIKKWVLLCKESMNIDKIKPPLVGYCSWYAKTHNISPKDIYRAIDDFSNWPSPSGGKTIQIDDGFQIMPGDWRPNKRWENDMELMPVKIREAGAIPGLWLAPTAIHESHWIVKEHPEWLQRLPSGEFAISFSNWEWSGEEGSKTFYLEADHPEARKIIVNIIKEKVDKGWEYLKIDFAYTVSTARMKYDRKKTRFETLKDLWKLFKDTCGEEILINACVGGIWRWSAGASDIARIGGDMIGQPEIIRERLAEILLRMNSNGKWWQSDPDVFCIWRENFKLDSETAYLLTATEGLMGGVFITSDFASDWDEQGVEAVREFWNENGPRVPEDYYAVINGDGMPRAFAVSYSENDDMRYGIAIYNWQNKTATTKVGLKELRISAENAWDLVLTGRNQSIILVDGNLTVKDQPPNSVRIAWLR